MARFTKVIFATAIFRTGRMDWALAAAPCVTLKAHYRACAGADDSRLDGGAAA